MKKIMKDPDNWFGCATILLVTGFTLVYFGLVVVGAVALVFGFFVCMAAVAVSELEK